jgi:hypothetical protein
MESNFIVFIVLSGAVLIWLFIYVTGSKGNWELEAKYKECLQGTDKRAALSAARAYYQSLRRNGNLTLYDEMAIANDLSTMDVLTESIPNDNSKSERI